MPRRILRHRAVLRALRARIGRRAAARNVPPVVGAHVAAELDAGVAARDVVEAFTIKRADLHVLDRLGLDGKIGSLCPSDRNQTGCGPEEKTFRHLHYEPPSSLSWEGSVSAKLHSTPWKVPFSPPVPPSLRQNPFSENQTGRPWDAPHRRTLTLTNVGLQATMKEPFEQARIQFFGKCCEKNTH